jgi:hypothetical protein
MNITAALLPVSTNAEEGVGHFFITSDKMIRESFSSLHSSICALILAYIWVFAPVLFKVTINMLAADYLRLDY